MLELLPQSHKTYFLSEIYLAQALRGVASDLRLIDFTNLYHLHMDNKVENIAELVSSSAELFFRPGFLNFHSINETKLNWHFYPAMSFNMELNADKLTIFFDLVIEKEVASISIKNVQYEDQFIDEGELDIKLIQNAINSALYISNDFN